MKQSFGTLLLFAFILTFSIQGCKPKEVIQENVEETEQEMQEVEIEIVEEEPCNYNTITGKGVITKMNFSNPDNVVIKFTFQPSEKYTSIFPEISNKELVFNVDGIGKYPPRKWCEENGVEQGASFSCVRYELRNGNTDQCPKVTFSFTAFEDEGW